MWVKAMSKICEWVLAADERIRFAMLIDDLGNTLCMKTVGYYEISEDLAFRLGDTLAVLIGGIFKELSALHGPFEYAMVKHGSTVVVGLKLDEGYLIFSAKEDVTPEIVQRVKGTIKIYRRESR